MGQILSYSIVTSVILAILYLMYKWLFSGEKQPRYNRAVLWSVYLMAFAAVPVTDAIISYAAASRPSGDAGIEIGTITASIVESADNSPHLAWLATIYLAGLLAATLLTLFTAFRLARIIRSGRHIHKEGYTVVLTDDSATAPFSWGRYMVMNEADYGDGASPVVLHERAHIERRHWVDLLAGQLVAIFQWYNPAAWLMREEMKALHEYQADAAVLESGTDARSYQMLLIKKAVGARFPSLANSLNHSKLKKRITMMYKQKSSVRSRLLRAAALVPALAAAVAVFQVPQVANAIGAVSEISLSSSGVAADDMPVAAMPSAVRKVTIISENTETAGTASAQTTRTKSAQVSVVREGATESADKPVNTAAVMPEFPGGMQGLMQYLSKNIRFPENRDCATGRVLVQFVVNKEGKVSDISILKSVGPEVDAEAVRVVSSMPDFTPGKDENGKPVSVYYALPISFQTTGDDDTPTAAKAENSPSADANTFFSVDGKKVTREEAMAIVADKIASMNVNKEHATVHITLKK